MNARILLYAIFLSLLPSLRSQDSLLMEFRNVQLSDSLRLAALHKYARSQLYSNPDSALHYALIEQEYAESILDSNWIASALNLQGGALWIKSDFAGALDRFTRSNDIRIARKDTIGSASALSNIGNIYFTRGDYSTALHYYLRSQELEEKKGDKNGLATSYLNIGSIYARQDEHDKALAYFEKALSMHEALDNKLEMGSCYHNIGNVYKSKGNYLIARENYDRAIRLMQENGDMTGLAVTYVNLAEVYRMEGDSRTALEFYDQSLSMQQQLGDKAGMARVLVNKGLTYQLMARNREARDACSEGLKIAESLGAMLEMQDACDCLYLAYKGLGDNETALRYFEQYSIHRDSIAKKETGRQLQLMEFRRQVAEDSLDRKKEQEALVLSHASELKRESRKRNLLILSGTALLGFSLVLYRTIRKERRSKQEIFDEKAKSDKLLLTILPANVAKELKDKGKLIAREFEGVTVLFTDFIDFTGAAAQMNPQEIVDVLNLIFQQFDEIVSKYGIEKIKTIGDAYMAAGGLPVSTDDTTRNTVMAAIEMQEYLEERRRQRESQGLSGFRMRVGLHTGKVIAGIVGRRNFQYDIYGDTVNMASRMEQVGAGGKVNISVAIYEQIKDDPAFHFEQRGKVMVKGKREVEMWFVSRK